MADRESLPLDEQPVMVTETSKNPVARKSDVEEALLPIRRWLWIASGIGVVNLASRTTGDVLGSAVTSAIGVVTFGAAVLFGVAAALAGVIFAIRNP